MFSILGSLQCWVSCNWPRLGSFHLLFFWETLSLLAGLTVFFPTGDSTKYNFHACLQGQLVASHLISSQALNSKWPMLEISLESQFSILCNNFLQ